MGQITVVSPPFLPDAANYVQQVLNDNPVAYYRLRSSSQMTDSIGNNEGTYNGDILFSTPGALSQDAPDDMGAQVLQWRTGSTPPAFLQCPSPGGSYDFDPALGAVYSPDHLYTAGALVAVENWVSSSVPYPATDSPYRSCAYILYRCIQTSQGNDPKTSPQYWQLDMPDNFFNFSSWKDWSIEFWLRSDYFQLNNGYATERTPFVQGAESIEGWDDVQMGQGLQGVQNGFMANLLPQTTTIDAIMISQGFDSSNIWQYKYLAPGWHHCVMTNESENSFFDRDTQFGQTTMRGRKTCFWVDGQKVMQRIRSYRVGGQTNTGNSYFYEHIPQVSSTPLTFLCGPGFTVNRYPSSSPSHGFNEPFKFSEIALYDRCLNETQILAHKNAAP